MKIVIATPLYPPDIEPAAVYVKELARRLSATHQVTVVAYSEIPEEVPGVTYISVSKKSSLPLRLLRFFFALRRAIKSADLLYVENGSSVELPTLLLRRMPLILHIGDQVAHQWTQKKTARRAIEQRVMRRARIVVTDSPPQKPEILPFTATPPLAEWDTVWEAHLAKLEKIFHGK